MKWKVGLVLVAAIVLCVSIIVWSQSKKVLSTPDKIIIYEGGNVKELDKNNSEFQKIVDLTNGRFNNKISTALDIINDDAIKSIQADGLGIEFIYNNEQSMSMKGDGFQPFKYYKLYFQLTSKKSGNSQGSTVDYLQYGDKDHYKDCSRGPLKSSVELVKLVEGLK